MSAREKKRVPMNDLWNKQHFVYLRDTRSYLSIDIRVKRFNLRRSHTSTFDPRAELSRNSKTYLCI